MSNTTDTITVNKPEEVNIITNKPALVAAPPKDKLAQAKESLSNDDLKEVAINNVMWENRRRVMWIFTYGLLAFIFLLLFILLASPKEVAERFISATDILTWSMMALLSPIALYFGGTVIEKFTGVNKKT